MKKTCNGCYAADRNGHPLVTERAITGCHLGYRNEDGKPQEECPKPKSWRQLEQLKRAKNND